MTRLPKVIVRAWADTPWRSTPTPQAASAPAAMTPPSAASGPRSRRPRMASSAGRGRRRIASGSGGSTLTSSYWSRTAWSSSRTTFSAASALSPARTKRAIWESLDHGLDDGLDAAHSHVERHLDHPDPVEGAKAFLEKRPPKWLPYRGTD